MPHHHEHRLTPFSAMASMISNDGENANEHEHDEHG